MTQIFSNKNISNQQQQRLQGKSQYIHYSTKSELIPIRPFLAKTWGLEHNFFWHYQCSTQWFTM